MGKRETPAHEEAIILPPSSDAQRASECQESEPLLSPAPPPSERTLLRAKESESPDAPGGELRSAEATESEPRESEPGEAESGKAESHEAESPEAESAQSEAREPGSPVLADAPAGSADVELRPSESGSRRSPSVPPLPVAALERPTELRADLTPSPVPRVSLRPPTSRIDTSQLLELSAPEGLVLPAVEPRPQSSRVSPITGLSMPGLSTPGLSTPAFAIPLVARPRRPSLARRLADDVRHSKREIALGLVIGIVLSFVVGKLGQSYLESRSRGPELVVQSFANEPAPRPAPPRAPAPAVPSIAPPVVATPLLPAVARPAVSTPAAPAAPRAAPGPRRPERAGSAKPASGEAPVPAAPPNAAPGGGPPPPSVPLSPAENAGLGLELPL